MCSQRKVDGSEWCDQPSSVQIRGPSVLLSQMLTAVARLFLAVPLPPHVSLDLLSIYYLFWAHLHL